MITFLTEKKGYKKKDVDDYIKSMQNDLEYIKNQLRSKDIEIIELKRQINAYYERENLVYKTIETAVIVADKVKQDNILTMKNKQDNIEYLFQRMNSFFNSLKKEYPNATINKNSDFILQAISNAIDFVFKESITSKDIDLIFEKFNNDYKKTIISNAQSGGVDNFKHVIVRNERPRILTPEEQDYKNEVTRLLNIQKEKGKELKQTNKQKTMNQSKNTDNEVAFSVIQTQDKRKFDFQEALNPTMDLAEIMKSFDLE